MTIITIRYQSPKRDPLKVPRPHRVTIGDDGKPSEVTGGEIGPIDAILGFARGFTPDFHNTETWVTPEQVAEAVAAGELKGDGFKGWRVAFVADGEMFTYEPKIARLEVTP